MSQGEVWAGLRKARTLATGFVSRAAAAPATPLKRVHDTFHKALRDADAAPLGQPLAERFAWTDHDRPCQREFDASPVPNFAVLWKNHVVLIAWRDIQWLWEGNATVIESDLLCLTQTILGCGIAWCDACTIRHNGEKECRSTIPAAFIRRLDPIRTSANTWEVLSARCSQSLIRVRFGRRVTYATSR